MKVSPPPADHWGPSPPPQGQIHPPFLLSNILLSHTLMNPRPLCSITTDSHHVSGWAESRVELSRVDKSHISVVYIVWRWNHLIWSDLEITLNQNFTWKSLERIWQFLVRIWTRYFYTLFHNNFYNNKIYFWYKYNNNNNYCYKNVLLLLLYWAIFYAAVPSD